MMESVHSFNNTHLTQVILDEMDGGESWTAIDTGAFLLQSVCLAIPRSPFLIVSPSRLELRINSTVPVEYLISDRNNTDWLTVYATNGPWGLKLFSAASHKDIVQSALVSISQGNNHLLLVARVIDLVYSTHLHSQLLAYPMLRQQIFKKKIITLGYNVEEMVTGDKMFRFVLERCLSKLSAKLQVYHEFTVNTALPWRAGLTSTSNTLVNTFAGATVNSFGFCSSGCILYKNIQSHYITIESTTIAKQETFGILTDLSLGSISLVVDGKVQPAAFGFNSKFSLEEQSIQSKIIQKKHLFPAFSLEKTLTNAIGSVPTMRVNFGESTFSFTDILATSCSAHVKSLIIIPESLNSIPFKFNTKEKMDAEEDRLQQANERNLHKTSLITNDTQALIGFSHFPPSVYRRTFGARIIQRGNSCF